MLAVLAPQPPLSSTSKPRREPLLPLEGVLLAPRGSAESARTGREATTRARARAKAAANRNRKLGRGKVRVASHTASAKLRLVNKSHASRVSAVPRKAQRARPSFSSSCSSQTGPAIKESPSSLNAGARFSKAACPTKLSPQPTANAASDPAHRAPRRGLSGLATNKPAA